MESSWDHFFFEGEDGLEKIILKLGVRPVKRLWQLGRQKMKMAMIMVV